MSKKNSVQTCVRGCVREDEGLCVCSINSLANTCIYFLLFCWLNSDLETSHEFENLWEQINRQVSPSSRYGTTFLRRIHLFIFTIIINLKFRIKVSEFVHHCISVIKLSTLLKCWFMNFIFYKVGYWIWSIS